MSWTKCPNANAHKIKSPIVELVLEPSTKDLGGFEVRRALPSPQRQMVGPFIFFDQMGPSTFPEGLGIDVRPHPHIGLATITYLFEGAILHRDSLGTELVIRPGDVNWMKAGRGIVHSERTPADSRMNGSHRLSGIQAWLALPKSQEQGVAAFTHYAADELPHFSHHGAAITLIAGRWLGKRSPVAADSPTLYAEIRSENPCKLTIPIEYEERALYTVEGSIELDGQRFDAGSMVILTPGVDVTIHCISACHLMLLGGDAVDGERLIWWNFVASDQRLIDQARTDWTNDRFDPVPNETERIPLPE